MAAAVVVLAGCLPGRSSRAGRARSRRASSRSRRSPGSPPATSVITCLPPPRPMKRTLNQDFARRSGLGPSPGLSRFSRRCGPAVSGRRPTSRPTPTDASGNHRQPLHRGVVRVAEVGAVVVEQRGPSTPTICGSTVGSGTAQKPCWRWILPATALADRPSGRGSARRLARWASRCCFGRDNAVIAVWNVPPEGRPPAADQAVDLDRDALGQLLDGELDAEVVRDRVEAARVDDAGHRSRRPRSW